MDQKTDTSKGFIFVLVVVASSILGLFGLPLVLIYATRGGC